MEMAGGCIRLPPSSPQSGEDASHGRLMLLAFRNRAVQSRVQVELRHLWAPYIDVIVGRGHREWNNGASVLLLYELRPIGLFAKHVLLRVDVGYCDAGHQWHRDLVDLGLTLSIADIDRKLERIRRGPGRRSHGDAGASRGSFRRPGR